ncbi:HTH domain-containing protein [Halomarina halobia]|uniref:HTH domain-containing protein n=1 Tax=Halomarina halobia TaxID=3033386 RepID=A0ABD6A4P9_9EURY|nr:HTH domain-containing protein [Halomarina sp. PSR21]
MSNATGELTIACHVRPTQLLEPIDAHVETLKRCEREGHIDGLVLRSWPSEVSLSGSVTSDETIETFRRFRRWAERQGVSICPPFERRTRVSEITNERREILRTPLVCLAIYVDDRLGAVFPHTEGERTYGVTEVTATLRAGDLPPRVDEACRSERVEFGTCPDCAEPIVSGQGVLACPDCRWTATVAPGGRYRDVPGLRDASALTVGRQFD